MSLWCIQWTYFQCIAKMLKPSVILVCPNFSESGVTAEVVAAVDVNTTANQIYKHNFPGTALWSKTIEVSQSSV